MKRVFDYLDSLNIDKNELVVVACSGGPDSMCLLHILKNMGYNLICAHVNHKVRRESDDEYQFVKDYCDRNNIVFEGIELAPLSNGNFENYAREFRYKWFDELTKKYDAKYVFTAHHGDDLVETILMRLVRGSSLKGYRGFDIITSKSNYKLVRPLIFLTKDVICEYLDSNNLEYVIDRSNESDVYTRNRYRQKVLPFLKEEDKDVHLRFLAFNETLKETYDYIERVVDHFLKDNYHNNELNIGEFKKLDRFIQVKVLESIFRLIFIDNLYLINKNHTNMVLDIIYSNKVSSSTLLVGNLSIIKSNNKLKFILDKESHGYKLLLEERLVIGDERIEIVNECDDTSNYTIRLDSRSIKMPLYIRSRSDGDKINVKNMKGSKKVSDIFIDNKIDIDKRDTWPLLIDSDDTVLWVLGLKKSKFDIPIDGVYDIIVRYETGGKNNE